MSPPDDFSTKGKRNDPFGDEETPRFPHVDHGPAPRTVEGVVLKQETAMRKHMIPPPIPRQQPGEDEATPVDALLQHEKRATEIMLAQVQQAERIERAAARMEPFAAGWRWVPIAIIGNGILLAALLAVVSIVSVALLGRH